MSDIKFPSELKPYSRTMLPYEIPGLVMYIEQEMLYYIQHEIPKPDIDSIANRIREFGFVYGSSHVNEFFELSAESQRAVWRKLEIL